ncbi:MAG: prevent-host-death protein [Gammaproteobacteria bacterium]|nr:prevent-host-death protein [Gammaproteobacteria bacterium]MDE0367712.1 prevent-host-death protein [Gammaproteobacteria bacterium]
MCGTLKGSVFVTQDTSLTEGPQIVIRRGVQTAVLIPIDEWRRLKRAAGPRVKDLLLAPEARTEALTAPRTVERLRPTPNLD